MAQLPLGYLLSGPTTVTDYTDPKVSAFHITTTSKTKVDTLTKFWDLESIGIHDYEQDENNDFDRFCDKFIEKQGKQYISKLPWKGDHEALPTNYE